MRHKFVTGGHPSQFRQYRQRLAADIFGHLQSPEWFGLRYPPPSRVSLLAYRLLSGLLTGQRATNRPCRDSVGAKLKTVAEVALHNRFDGNKMGTLDREGSVIAAREGEPLLLRAQTGASEALNLLFESCRRSLYFRALRILARPQDAEDAVQEAMLAAFTRLHQFERRADFLTWATRIVINTALQQIRKTRTKPTVAWEQVDKEFDGASFSEYIRDRQPTPEEHLQRLEQSEVLEAALHKLPVDMRRAIQLCKFADYSLQEATSVLGLSVSTLKARLRRGKRALMVRVKGETRARPKPTASKQSSRLCPASKERLRAA